MAAMSALPLQKSDNSDVLVANTNHAVSVRLASLADLDAMVDIGLAAMPLDPQWNWRFPHRLAFPDDHRKFTRSTYRYFLENKAGNWVVMLAEIVVPGEQGSVRPAAFAVWNLANLTSCERSGAHRDQCTSGVHLTDVDANLRPPHMAMRRDGNEQRIRAWADSMPKAKARLFDSAFRDRYFQLQILATHPDFQRQGAGSALCAWGLRESQLRGLAVAVFASPMGRLLYSHLGFTKVGCARISVPGETEHVEVAAMVYAV
jgi:GNAT superfamily N-acetyltransferase